MELRTIVVETDNEMIPRPAGGKLAPIADSIMGVILSVPHTRERAVHEPAARARAIVQAASRRASLTAGSLALPPGPLGWITILPELVTVWKIQSQMVSDIAGAYGKHAELTREHMLYCLFRYAAAQAVRDLAVRVGQRVLVRRLSSQAAKGVAGQVALQLAHRIAHKGAARWLPAIGAIGVGAYAWYDTRKVGEAALEILGTGAESVAAAGEDRAPHAPFRGKGGARFP